MDIQTYGVIKIDTVKGIRYPAKIIIMIFLHSISQNLTAISSHCDVSRRNAKSLAPFLIRNGITRITRMVTRRRNYQPRKPPTRLYT